MCWPPPAPTWWRKDSEFCYLYNYSALEIHLGRSQVELNVDFFCFTPECAFMLEQHKARNNTPQKK